VTAPLAAVTGGTGFVGRHVLRALTTAGWRLRLLVRRDPDLALGDTPVELIPGSLDDPKALADLVRCADAVLHMGGAIKARGKVGFMAANADGTAAMVNAWSTEAPRARFVLLSSLAARQPELSHYAASKAAGEAIVRAAAGANWCILRSCSIYGPGDRETLTVFKAAGYPVQPLLNGPDARLCLIHVQDVVAGILAALNKDGPTGTFELSDARRDGYTWGEVVEAACNAVNGRKWALHIPKTVVRAIGRLGDIGAAISGSAEMVTSQKVNEILHPDWSSTDSAQLPSTHWAPRISLAQGFSETVAWYRAAGWLG